MASDTDPIELETDTGAPGAAAPKSGDPLDDLPPDSGPEQHVLTVHPSMWRGQPFSSVALALLPIVAGVLLAVFVTVSWKWQLTLSVFGLLVVLCWGTLLVRWITTSVSRSLKVTNKRVIERRGLFSRSTDEVVLDHIRNVQVYQSFIDRIFGIGQIGISSSGQDGIEIEMADIPRPDEIKKILDRYRSM
ncbi:MAG: PH domain-containing protein [Planctomycetota bacterium]